MKHLHRLLFLFSALCLYSTPSSATTYTPWTADKSIVVSAWENSPQASSTSWIYDNNTRSAGIGGHTRLSEMRATRGWTPATNVSTVTPVGADNAVSIGYTTLDEEMPRGPRRVSGSGDIGDPGGVELPVGDVPVVLVVLLVVGCIMVQRRRAVRD